MRVKFLILLKFVSLSVCLKLNYNQFMDTDFSTGFSQMYLIKSFNINSKMRCLAECDKLSNCYSVKYTSSVCYLYSESVTNVVSQIYTSSSNIVFNKSRECKDRTNTLKKY